MCVRVCVFFLIHPSIGRGVCAQAYIRGAKCHLALGEFREASSLLDAPRVRQDADIRAEVCGDAGQCFHGGLWRMDLVFPQHLGLIDDESSLLLFFV
jgi:hypothetical protein